MIKRLVFLSLLSALLLSGCSNNDELSGKTFDVSEFSGLNDPGYFFPIITLEFLDGKVITKSIDGDEGTYELKEDKLVIQFENENESLDIEFTLEDSDNELSEYSAEISDLSFQMKNSDLVSKYKGVYLNLNRDHVQFIER